MYLNINCKSEFKTRSVSYPNFGMYTKSYNFTTETRATEQYFPMVLFIMLYKVVLTFESMDENLICDRSNKSY